jgi:hypothetical protein
MKEGEKRGADGKGRGFIEEFESGDKCYDSLRGSCCQFSIITGWCIDYLWVWLVLLRQIVTIVSCLVSVEQAVIGNLSANLSRPVALTKIEKHA